MNRYKLLEWIDERKSSGAYTEKYSVIGDKGQAEIDTRFLYLRDQPESNWRPPQARKLSRKYDHDCDGIIEIRFEANRVQQRPLGFFGPGKHEFTVLLWATHKGNQWKPSNYCEIAQRRKNEIIAGDAKSREIEID